uniref:Uncharacterized protein n=1 Tax=Noccaea caerulescens TaxID=107243 RepID=A0A1J3HP99_NOCCA
MLKKVDETMKLFKGFLRGKMRVSCFCIPLEFWIIKLLSFMLIIATLKFVDFGFHNSIEDPLCLGMRLLCVWIPLYIAHSFREIFASKNRVMDEMIH